MYSTQSTLRASRTTTALSIERRASATLPYDTFIREYVVANRPVIIENAAPQWNALRTWTPQFFKDKFGSRVVCVTYGKFMPLGELIDAAVASSAESPGPYLHQLIVHRDMPELLADLTPGNTYAFPRRFSSRLMMPGRCRRPDGYLKLLIGGPGGKFPFMHFDVDNSNALITEIYGDKEFVLFPPEDTSRIYPKQGRPNVSEIEDPVNPDLEKFPLFASATPYRSVLRPGETIFIPAGWWHSARVVSMSISVGCNMMDASNWKGFVNWVCQPAPGTKWTARSGKRVLLTGVGMTIGVLEALRRSLPESVSRSLASLAPLSLADTPAKQVYKVPQASQYD